MNVFARQVEGAAKEKEEHVDALARLQAAHDAASRRIEELLVCWCWCGSVMDMQARVCVSRRGAHGWEDIAIVWGLV